MAEESRNHRPRTQDVEIKAKMCVHVCECAHMCVYGVVTYEWVFWRCGVYLWVLLSVPHFKTLLIKASASSVPILFPPTHSSDRENWGWLLQLPQDSTDPLIQASGNTYPIGFSWLILDWSMFKSPLISARGQANWLKPHVLLKLDNDKVYFFLSILQRLGQGRGWKPDSNSPPRPKS